MSIARWRYRDLLVRISGGLILLMLATGATSSIAQQRTTPPTVVAAAVPFYPRTTQMAHIEGVVRLRISTDGTRPSSIEIESGQPMLAQAAKENVKTWLFEEHSPTTFETTYRYKLLHSGCDAKCTCDSTEKDSVLLKLPAEVEVSAKELIVCEPAGDRKD